MKHFVHTLFTALLLSFTAIGQSVFAPLNQDYYYLIDRYEIKGSRIPANLHTTNKMISRSQIAELADSALADSAMKLSARDQFNLAYLQNDNWEWSGNGEGGDSKKPFLKYFYQKQNAFAQFHNKDFAVQLNPVFYGSIGKENDSDVRYTTLNSRGLEIRGSIDNKVGFYAMATDNQASFPIYVRNMISQLSTTGRPIVPGESYIKSTGANYRTTDFISARGYITFNLVKHIGFQFGYDKQFIGNGYRSLVLSDNSAAFPFLKVTANVWKLDYTMLVAQMTANVTPHDTYFRKKYFAYHRLGLNVGKKLNIGLFESICYGAQDSLGRTSFDISYLNPVIFYRAAEQSNGSSDNIVLGADLKWNFARHFSFYSQLAFDEFKISEMRSGKGWWANKWALQGGLKYVDVLGLKNLDLQLEANVVRPYTYGHTDNVTNYSNYLQPLAHPLGANFEELIAIVRYQPLKRVTFTAQACAWRQGLDNDTSNVGANIFKPNRPDKGHEYGNKIGQGVKQTVLLGSLTMTYMIRHNLFIDLQYIYRKPKTEGVVNERTTNYASFSLRWNLPKRFYAF